MTNELIERFIEYYPRKKRKTKEDRKSRHSDYFWSWLAGFWEGEGTIFYKKYDYCKIKYLAVCNTSKKSLTFIKNVIGFGSVVGRNRDNRKNRYDWIIRGYYQIISVAEKLMDYLIFRNKEIKNNINNIKNNFDEKLVRGKPIQFLNESNFNFYPWLAGFWEAEGSLKRTRNPFTLRLIVSQNSEEPLNFIRDRTNLGYISSNETSKWAVGRYLNVLNLCKKIKPYLIFRNGEMEEKIKKSKENEPENLSNIRWSKREINKLKELYSEKSAKHISNILGRSVDSVSMKAQLMGLTCEFGSEEHGNKMSRSKDNGEKYKKKDWLEKEYKNKTMSDIAKEFGVSRSTISHFLHKFNIETRNKKEAGKIGAKK